MNKNRIKSYLPLTFLLALIICLVPSFADRSVTVDAYMQNGDEVFYFDDLSVDSGLAGKYGIEYGGNIKADDVTAIDVLVAMHKKHYGAKFTKETMEQYLAVSYTPSIQFVNTTDAAIVADVTALGNGLGLQKLFAVEKKADASYFSVGFAVNGVAPSSDIFMKSEWGDYYFGYTYNQAIVNDDDNLHFYTPYMSSSMRFCQNKKPITTINAKVDEKIKFGVKTYSASFVNENGKKVLKPDVKPANAAKLVNLNDNSAYTINANGMVELSFAKAGKYQLVAKQDGVAASVLNVNVTAVVKEDDDDNNDTEDRAKPDYTADSKSEAENAGVIVKVTDKQSEKKSEVEEKTKAIKVIEFSDVKAGDWYFKAVGNCVANGLIKGYPDDTFKPEAKMTRAMFTTILYRMAGEPTVTGDNKYADIADDAWYVTAANWAKGYNISAVLGSEFVGDKPITREEMMVMLYAYVDIHTDANQTADIKVLEKFVDGAEVSAENKVAVAWAIENYVIKGNTDNKLMPKSLATRAEVAQMLTNFDKGDMAEFSEEVRVEELQLLLDKNKMLYEKSDKTLDNNNPANPSFHVRPLAEKLAVFEKATDKNAPVWDKLRDEVYFASEGDDTAPLAFEQIDEYTAENYGCSWKNGKLYLKGFAASPYPELSQQLDPKAKDINEKIKAFAEKNKAVIAKQNHVIGTWIDTENPEKPVLYLDVSVIYDTAEEARQYCLEKEQLAFYDLVNGEEVRVK